MLLTAVDLGCIGSSVFFLKRAIDSFQKPTLTPTPKMAKYMILHVILELRTDRLAIEALKQGYRDAQTSQLRTELSEALRQQAAFVGPKLTELLVLVLHATEDMARKNAPREGSLPEWLTSDNRKTFSEGLVLTTEEDIVNIQENAGNIYQKIGKLFPRIGGPEDLETTVTRDALMSIVEVSTNLFN